VSGSFSEDEARQIFARAAERQHAAEAKGEELSLDELKAIGAAAGLDPAHVAAAVAELRTGPPPEPAVVQGVDLAPRRVRVLPVPLTDELWAAMVLRLRRTYGTSGVVSEVGPVREWRSGPSSRLHVVAEPVEGGTRVTIETARDRSDAHVPWALGLGGAALSLFMLVLGVAKDHLADPALWVFAALFLVLGVVGAVASRRSVVQWSARRQGEFAGFLDHIDADVQEGSFRPVTAEASSEAEVRESRVDPELLDATAPDAAAEEDATERRGRRRV